MTITIIKGIFFSALLIYAAVTDIKRREIENFAPVSILIVSLIGTGGSFGGAVTTMLPFFIPAALKTENVGGGDIKLMFACGAVLGVWGGMAQIIAGLALAALYGLFLLIVKGYTAYKKNRYHSRRFCAPEVYFLSSLQILEGFN